MKLKCHIFIWITKQMVHSIVVPTNSIESTFKIKQVKSYSMYVPVRLNFWETYYDYV